MSFQPVLGIDWGSHTIKWCYLTEPQGNNAVTGVIPASVAFQDGRLIVGEPAHRVASSAPKRAVMISDIHLSAESTCVLGEREFGVVEIVFLMLKEIIQRATMECGIVPGRVAIVVPTHFSYSQRNVLQAAAILAGQEVRLLDASSTVALTVRDHTDPIAISQSMVIDIGAALKCAVVFAVNDEYQLRYFSCDDNLGGNEWTDSMVVEFIQQAKRERIPSDVEHWEDDEACRVELRQRTEDTMQMLAIHENAYCKPAFLKAPLSVTRQALQRKVHLLDETIHRIKSHEHEGTLGQDYLNIVLLGGMTLHPHIRSAIAQAYPNTSFCCIQDPVFLAQAAAFAAQAPNDKDQMSRASSLTAHPIGVSLSGEVAGDIAVVIPEGLSLPCSAAYQC